MLKIQKVGRVSQRHVKYCILVKFIRGDDKAVYRNLCSFSILGENIEARQINMCIIHSCNMVIWYYVLALW